MASETAAGEIQRIAEDKASFVLATTGEKRMTVRVNDDTVYLLDGKIVDRDKALKVGRNATVTHEDGLATRIEIASEDPRRGIL